MKTFGTGVGRRVADQITAPPQAFSKEKSKDNRKSQKTILPSRLFLKDQ
jgi:hypothetical protein